MVAQLTAMPIEANPVATHRRLMTERDAAAYLSVSLRTMYTLRRDGKLKHVPIGINKVRYDIADLDAFIEQSKR